MSSLKIPDLRFEQAFWRQLYSYAGIKEKSERLQFSGDKSRYKSLQAKLGDREEEIMLLNEAIDREEQDYLESQQPLPPITPGIVIYAIIKDQLLLPFIQGFFLTGILISIRPFLHIFVQNGQRADNLNQPNSGALAAALTIGNTMKQKAANPHIPRSQSFSQHPQFVSQNRTSSITESRSGSLLKRQSKSNMFQKPQSSYVQQSRRFSDGSLVSNVSEHYTPMTSTESTTQYGIPIVYNDVNDGFNDSYLDEITEESTQVYLNNKAKMKDLRLPVLSKQQQHQQHHQQHQHQHPQYYRNGETMPKQESVKMVKKYIPSPTGIKVIEVPESSIKKEMVRSNSMRMNSYTPRSNSSLKRSTSRSASLTKLRTQKANASGAEQSAMPSMKENVALEETLGRNDETIAQKNKLKLLEEKIEKEKQLAKEVEIKRLEYEKLHKSRLEKEKALREYEHLQEKEPFLTERSGDEKMSSKQNISVETSNNHTEIPDEGKENPTNVVVVVGGKGGGGGGEPKLAQSEDTNNEQELSEDKSNPAELVTGNKEESKSVELITSGKEEEKEEEPETIIPILHEQKLESNSKPQSTTDQNGDSIEETSTDAIVDTNKESSTIDQNDYKHEDFVDVMLTEMRIKDEDKDLSGGIAALGEEEASNDLSTERYEDDDNAHNVAATVNSKEEHPLILKDDGTIEILEGSDSSYPSTAGNGSKNLSLRSPKNSGAESLDLLSPPTMESTSSSKSSVYSGESIKRPMKSAMKTPSSTSFSQPQQAIPQYATNSNAAHQAYLSLTTAENTRLNSKSSSLKLTNGPQSTSTTNRPLPNHHQRGGDFANLGGVNGGAYPQVSNSTPFQRTSQKRLSQQSLRNNFYPQQKPHTRQNQIKPEIGMSGRTMRHSTYVQPVEPHSSVQTGYVSSPKVKAQDLYAKAKARPYSNFGNMKRHSSFSREMSGDDQQKNLQTSGPNKDSNLQVKAGMQAKTLRAPPQSNPTQHNNGSLQPQQLQPQLEVYSSSLSSSSQYPQMNNKHAGTTAYNNATTSRSTSGTGFKSRFNDSDDDLPNHSGRNGKTFASRFVDSDDDLPNVSSPSSSFPVANVHSSLAPSQPVGAFTLRSAEPEVPPQHKKKFGKLRKLFGQRY
ncbi:hypothetical protein KGF56_000524 [Candida oxycetoniae]|uniref:Uncharacterized protein n=1 Tax=Candida oxycetoniae TaxID=497107 RepID=A0AAI9T0R6_9ASCO|nr:uncharacterized protein KGF56_000524 [Candida oxycetoniae]KAI3406678.2 hypothetical protein KGF56_000524 [Candida oxycetoniae]